MSKKIAITLAVIVVLLVAAVAVYLRSGASADSVEALKGTKIQLVDEKGEKVAREVPISLVFNGTIRSCRVVRVFGFKGSRCSTVNRTFNGTAMTDANGEYTVSTSSYRRLTKDELVKVAQSLLQESVGRDLTSEEIKKILAVVTALYDKQNPTQADVTAAVNAQFKTSSANTVTNIATGFINTQVATAAFTNPIFAFGLMTGREEHGFSLINVVATVKTSLINSDNQIISFYSTDYKPSVNLTLNYNGAGLLAAAKDSYFAEIDKTSNPDADKQAIKDSVTGFTDYMSYYVVHIASLKAADIANKAKDGITNAIQSLHGTK